MEASETFETISSLILGLAMVISIAAGLAWGVQIYCVCLFVFILGVYSAVARIRAKEV